MATNSDEYRNDGALINVLTGLGVSGRDKSVATSIRTQYLLSEVELESLYLCGLPRRYVDAVADEILRHLVTITLGDDFDGNSQEVISSFETFLKVTEFHHALSHVIKLQRLYGGAGLVLLVNDGREPEEPIDMNRIQSISGYVPLSRYELIPEDYSITDYSRPNYYRITTSQRLTADQVSTYVNVKIHRSRVARFDGLYLPWNLRSKNTGWGQSCLQLLWGSYKRYESALAGLENMTGDHDLFVHKIPGLFQRIASGNENDLKKRLEVNNLSRSVYGGMVIDTEEDVDFKTRALSNISSATEPFIRDLQAATGWPASILMGDSPGGLGKEGRFEERVWASIVEQWQEVHCRNPITEVFTLILASRNGPTRGRVPQSWSVHFPSIFTKTDEEKAALRLQVAQSDNTYVSMGVLNPIEIRQSRFGGTEYSLETTLNERVTEQLVTQADMQFSTQLMNYQAQADALANPPETPEANGQPTQEQTEEQPAPDDEQKTDAIDVYSLRGMQIRVTHKKGDVKAGYLVAPDGQRIDSSQNAPLMVFGPHRTKSYSLYRARFVFDSELSDGPYVTGFASLRSARAAVAALFPRQTVAGLSVVPEVEAESLRAGWEVY